MKRSTFSDDDVLKHLELLNGIISRMAKASSDCKHWGITLISAIGVIAISTGSIAVLLSALIPLAGFAMLDAYYLAQEQAFRRLHEITRKAIQLHGHCGNILFNYKLTMKRVAKCRATCRVLRTSFAVWGPWGTILIALIVLFAVIA